MTNFILHIPTGLLFKQRNYYTEDRQFLNLLDGNKANMYSRAYSICCNTSCVLNAALECKDCPLNQEGDSCAKDVNEFEYIVVEEECDD